MVKSVAFETPIEVLKTPKTPKQPAKKKAKQPKQPKSDEDFTCVGVKVGDKNILNKYCKKNGRKAYHVLGMLIRALGEGNEK